MAGSPPEVADGHICHVGLFPAPYYKFPDGSVIYTCIELVYTFQCRTRVCVGLERHAEQRR